MFLKHIPHTAYTLQIYDIIVQHKEKFVETYTRYNFYFEYIHDIFAIYITYTLKIYDIVIQYKEIFF